MDEIAPHIFSWTAPHPEYRPRAEEVVSYALVAGEGLLLVDPLLPADEGRATALLAELDALAGAARRLELLVTIPYHTRSAEALRERYATHGADAYVGAPRSEEAADARNAARGRAGGRRRRRRGRRRRGAGVHDRPAAPQRAPAVRSLLRAVVFGDAVVGVPSGVRFWNQSATTGADWYRDVFAPTLAPLVEHDVEYVLVTHGPPVLQGRAASARSVPRRRPGEPVLRRRGGPGSVALALRLPPLSVLGPHQTDDQHDRRSR